MCSLRRPWANVHVTTCHRFLSLLTSNEEQDDDKSSTVSLTPHPNRFRTHSNCRHIYGTGHVTWVQLVGGRHQWAVPYRAFHLSCPYMDEEDPSVMERAVTSLKKKKQEKNKVQLVTCELKHVFIIVCIHVL